jgi:hypothetical protein
MVLIGAFSFLSFNYAANPKHRLLNSAITDEKIRDTKRQILTEPAIAILAAGLVYVDTVLWDLAFLLVPLLFMARKKLVTIKYFKFKKTDTTET